MFLTWLHTECGYRFTGRDGIYALTYGEMKLLYDGFETINEQREMQQKGVSQYEQAAFSEFADGVNSPGGATPAV